MLTALANVLKARGYDPHIDGLSAWNYGVPQHRPCLFLVGTPKGVIFEWPSEDSSHTPWQAIGNLPTVEASTRNEVRPYLGLPESERGQKLREGLPDNGEFHFECRRY